MAFPALRTTLVGAWIALAVLTCIALDPATLRAWIYVAVLSVVPPVVVLRFSASVPTQTVAELLNATEARR
jgi:hypothetical protein